MRVPYSWLREYCAPEASLEEVERALTLSGTKVEAIHHHGVGNGGENFVVGRVLSAEQHPNADRLKVCTVDLGDGEPAQIVCGAPNVAAGQTVAVARPGAVMPDGTKLKKAKLRGVESQGMILSESELEISQDHDGIMVLEDGAAEPGTPLVDVLPVAEDVIEFEITPNRPDCLGVYGIARELAAAFDAPLAPEPWAEDPGQAGAVPGVEIDVQAPDLCPRFTVRLFEDVKVGPSPAWLKARLTAAGMRPINNVVDITNYVMLLTGQPLHAFDADKVAGGRLTIRRARDGEQLQTLDGQVRTLDSDMVVIEDADGPTSLAGVMGGARSEVSGTTTRVLLEAASWIGHNIHRTSQKLALRSEASARFEKGLAPEQAMEAQIVATRLLVELCGARIVGGTIDAGPFAQDPPAPVVLPLRAQRVASLLGMEIDRGRQARRLEALGFGVEETDEGLSVTVPPFRRGDVTREVDLIEEVARFELDRLPATLPKRRGAAGHLTPEARLRRRALDALIDRGAYEVVGWSFADPGVADRLRLPEDDPRRRFVVLDNPMSEDQSVMRTTLLGSLLDAARLNVSRGAGDLTLVEQGTVYLRRDDRKLPDEHRSLGLLLHGRAHQPTWGVPDPRPVDFFMAKGMLEALLQVLRVDWAVERATEPFLHPGRAAKVLAGGEEIGWVGELHPLVAREWDLSEQLAGFELHLDKLVAHAVAVPRFSPISSFPPVRQDIAVVVPDEVTAARVVETVRKAGGALLSDARVFDVFRGEQVGEGRTSLGVALTFQAPDRTLSDEEVAPVREKIVAALTELGGELRG